jgi:subtilisin family serine protease
MRLVAACLITLGLWFALVAGAAAAAEPTPATFAVAYASEGALTRLTDGHARVVRRLPALHVAEIQPVDRHFAHVARRSSGIPLVARVVPRDPVAEPALFETNGFGNPFEWQYTAAHVDGVPISVLRAASAVTIAVIDTGVDLSAPDIASKRPQTYNLATRAAEVPDVNGHGTFVSSLAAGSVTNSAGVAGFGGDARLMVIKATTDDGELSDLDEAEGIVYAVDHGARVINLSVGGTTTSFVERRAVQYAADRGVLIVAAAGNEHDEGNPIEYPAALLQPVGSDGRGGTGLAVGASSPNGTRAFFSNTGSQLSLLAPGDDVFGALSSLSSPADYPRSALPGSGGGLYGFASGTSFAAPEVAGVAALVMAANPLLRATEVATIVKGTASNHGAWNPETGFGLLDAAAAVSAARGTTGLAVTGTRSPGHVKVQWYSSDATHYRVVLRVDKAAGRVLLAHTTATSISVRVRHGHRYAFAVTALNGGNQPVARTTYVVRG